MLNQGAYFSLYSCSYICAGRLTLDTSIYMYTHTYNIIQLQKQKWNKNLALGCGAYVLFIPTTLVCLLVSTAIPISLQLYLSFFYDLRSFSLLHWHDLQLGDVMTPSKLHPFDYGRGLPRWAKRWSSTTMWCVRSLTWRAAMWNASDKGRRQLFTGGQCF